MFGVLIGEPKQPSWPKPVSSSTMKRTLGAPGFGRMGSGQAGEESSIVRPMRPGNAVPGLYSNSSALAFVVGPVADSADAAINEPLVSRRSRRLIPARAGEEVRSTFACWSKLWD